MRPNYDMLIYEPDCDDFETEGLCGPLYPYEAHVIEQAADDYRLEFQHPYDEQGCWRTLAVGMVVRCWVLMRTPPAISDLGRHITSVEIWTVKDVAKSLRALNSKPDNTKNKILKTLPVGAEVVVTAKPSYENRYKVTTKWGAGWVDPEALEYSVSRVLPDTQDGIETVLPGAQLRPQLFEIYSVEMRLEGIAVYARHISYRLMKNLSMCTEEGALSLQSALDTIMDNCEDQTEFKAYTDIADTRTGCDWEWVNPLEIMLDPESGIVAKWPCEVLRDNFDFYFLEKVGVDRGVTIELGKNLSGITITTDMSGLATWLMPMGTDADGEVFLLDEIYVKSQHWSDYPYLHIYPFMAEGGHVGSGTTEAQALINMREEALAMLDAGCDLPTLTISVDVAQVDAAEAAGEDVSGQRAIISMLEPLLLYDKVHVHFRGFEYEEVVVERDWDPVHARMNSCVLGVSAGSMGNVQVATWQIPSGVSGGKIAVGTVGAGQVGSDVISTRHLQSGSVTTQILAAQSITAEKLAAGAVDAQAISALTAKLNAITAQTIDTDTLMAALAQVNRLAASEISSGSVTADTLAAAYASIVAAQFRAGTFDLATVTNLVASALTLQQGQANSMMITNLAVMSANLVNATIGKLVMRGDDDKYYEIGVGANGVISTAEITPTQQEIDAGEMSDGRGIIVEDSISAQSITGETIMAQEAVINQILTDALNAGQITAGDALIASASIPTLYTTSIEAIGTTIDISANDSIFLQAGDAGEDGHGLRKVLRLDTEGVHIGDTQSTTEVLIDASTVKVKQRGSASAAYSTFAGNYVQFGNYRLRRSADGGLAFNLAE